MIWDENTKPSKFLYELLKDRKSVLTSNEAQGLAFMFGKVVVLEDFFEKFKVK